jgi:hypothetical protein
MSLFAQRFAQPEPVDVALPGRYNRATGLRVDEAGQPIVLTAGAAAGTSTKAIRDTDEDWVALGPSTRADRDQPSPADALLLGPRKTAGGRDVENFTLLGSTVTFSGPDRD